MLHQGHPLRREVAASLRLAGPVVVAQLGQISMGFVDTVMVGRLGTEALAAVALGNTVFFFPFIVCMGVMAAVGPMVSQAFGAGEHQVVERSTRQGLWLAVVICVPAFLALRTIEPLLLAIGQEPATVATAQAYLKAITWGFLPGVWFMGLRGFAEALGRPWPVTLITLVGVGVNIGANAVLMYGLFGAPALGVVGTGWASAIVFWFMFIALAVFVGQAPVFEGYRIFSDLRRPDGHFFRELFRIGWPIGVSYGVESGLFTLTALLMGLLGTTALAAHQVALQCAAITFMVPLGIGIATSVRVGQAVGQRDTEGVRWAGYVGIGLALLFMIGTAVAFWTLPEAIISIYLDVNDPSRRETVELAVALLGVAAVFQVFDGLQVAASGALRGLKDTRVPMAIAFFSYWILGLSAGYLLGFVLEQGAVGLWWGLVLGLSSAALLLVFRFRRHARRQHVPAAPGGAS